MTTLFTIALIASPFLVFVVLAAFSNSTRAYAEISLLPLALGLTAFALRSFSGVGQAPVLWWADLYDKVLWASTIQTALGIALIARAIYRRSPLVLLTFTTFLAGSLLWVRVARWI